MKDFSPLQVTAAAVGFPARICRITRTDGGVFRFAESDEPIVIDGETFVVVPGVAISAVKHTNNGEMPSCQIAAVHSSLSVFDTNVIDVGLFDAARVQIYTVDRMNLSDKGLLFTGSIGTINYSVENQVIFEVKGLVQFARVLMTTKRSPMCRTDLFSELCGVDKTAYDVPAVVTMVEDAFNFRVSGPSNPDGWFNQGVMITASGSAIEIANWLLSVNRITTYLPCNRLVSVGMNLTLYPGCNKTLAACSGKFNNALNFQGEPHFLGTSAAAQQV